MAKDNTSSLNKLEQNFRELIIERCKFCGFDKYLEENPDFEFPKLTESLLEPYTQSFIAIPGMFGGFTFYLEEASGKFMLYAEQSSRMDYDSDSSSVFEVGMDGSRLLEGEERKVVWGKFRRLDRKRFEEHRREVMERRKHEPSERK